MPFISHHEAIEELIKQHDETHPFAPENGQPLKFKVGDKVTYTNGFGVNIEKEVTGLYQPKETTGFYATGKRYYLNTDCYWMPIAEESLSLAQ